MVRRRTYIGSFECRKKLNPCRALKAQFKTDYLAALESLRHPKVPKVRANRNAHETLSRQ